MWITIFEKTASLGGGLGLRWGLLSNWHRSSPNLTSLKEKWFGLGLSSTRYGNSIMRCDRSLNRITAQFESTQSKARHDAKSSTMGNLSSALAQQGTETQQFSEIPLSTGSLLKCAQSELNSIVLGSTASKHAHMPTNMHTHMHIYTCLHRVLNGLLRVNNPTRSYV